MCVLIGPNSYSGKEQIKGICSIPKRAVNVMDCEVARLLVLSQSAIIPLSFVVQRKVRVIYNARVITVVILGNHYCYYCCVLCVYLFSLM